MLWITVWFMVILKIPILYMCWVIWWAVKDPPEAGSDPALDELEDGGGPEWRRGGERDRRRTRRGGPHASPARRRAREAARARA